MLVNLASLVLACSGVDFPGMSGLALPFLLAIPCLVLPLRACPFLALCCIAFPSLALPCLTWTWLDLSGLSRINVALPYEGL